MLAAAFKGNVEAFIKRVSSFHLMLLLGGLGVLQVLKLLAPQDLQHICLYPAMEQYRLKASILQNAERSPRQRCPGDRGGTAVDQQQEVQTFHLKGGFYFDTFRCFFLHSGVRAEEEEESLLLDEFLVVTSALDLDSHWIMKFLWSPAGGNKHSVTLLSRHTSL